jgi:hypothetical protein
MNFLGLFAMIPQLIMMMEQFFPGKGQGLTKLNGLLGAISGIAAAEPTIAAAVKGQDVVTAITDVTNATVAAMTTVGALPAHTTPAPAAPAPTGGAQ